MPYLPNIRVALVGLFNACLGGAPEDVTPRPQVAYGVPQVVPSPQVVPRPQVVPGVQRGHGVRVNNPLYQHEIEIADVLEWRIYEVVKAMVEQLRDSLSGRDWNDSNTVNRNCCPPLDNYGEAWYVNLDKIRRFALRNASGLAVVGGAGAHCTWHMAHGAWHFTACQHTQPANMYNVRDKIRGSQVCDEIIRQCVKGMTAELYRIICRKRTLDGIEGSPKRNTAAGQLWYGQLFVLDKMMGQIKRRVHFE